MSDIDNARAQREALANVAGRRTAGPSRAAQAIERYLGAAHYEAWPATCPPTEDWQA